MRHREDRSASAANATLGLPPAELHAPASVRTVPRVDALIREPQAFHGLAVGKVRLHNLLNILGRDEAVPDRLGIHHQRHTVLALVQTARGIHSDPAGEPALSSQKLQPVTNLVGAFPAAATTRVSLRSRVGTHKNVSLERGHVFSRMYQIDRVANTLGADLETAWRRHPDEPPQVGFMPP